MASIVVRGDLLGPDGWDYDHSRYENRSDGEVYDIMGWNDDYTKNRYTKTKYGPTGWNWNHTEHEVTGTKFGPDGWDYWHKDFDCNQA